MTKKTLVLLTLLCLFFVSTAFAQQQIVSDIGSGPTPVAASNEPVSTNPNDPLAPHDSGIYMHKLHEQQLIMLEPALVTGTKEGGGFGGGLLKAVNPANGLISKKTRAVIQGKRANIRATDARPVFYFYFENTAAALGKPSILTGITSPNQIVLARLDAKDKTRETVIETHGIGGSSVGTDQKAIVTFRSERIRPGVYKVWFDEDLKDGEYAFLVGSAGTAAAEFAGAALPVPAQIFDFSVPKEK